MNLNAPLKLQDSDVTRNQKIIVFTAETIKGNNVGVIIDNVTSVTMVAESQIKYTAGTSDNRKGNFVKGIISMRSGAGSQSWKTAL